MNAAWPEVDAVAAEGVATGLATGDAAGDALGLVTTPTFDPPVGCGRLALNANITPTATAATKTAATPTNRYGRLRSAVSEMNVFMPVRCSQLRGWLHLTALSDLYVDHQASRVGEDGGGIAAWLGEAQTKRHVAFEVSQLAHL
jgi:hypothetical protein